MGNPKGVKRDFEALEQRRMRAVELFKQGLSQAEVGRKLGVARQSVHRWYSGWRSGGASELKKSDSVGRPSLLNAEQVERIVQALGEGPEKHGYVTGVWTLPRVAELIRREVGVEYHPAHVSRVLRAIGWSCQRPIGRAKQRDEEEIRRWKKFRWPALKKKRGKKAEK